jgi:hypothetical protein
MRSERRNLDGLNLRSPEGSVPHPFAFFPAKGRETAEAGSSCFPTLTTRGNRKDGVRKMVGTRKSSAHRERSVAESKNLRLVFAAQGWEGTQTRVFRLPFAALRVAQDDKVVERDDNIAERMRSR